MRKSAVRVLLAAILMANLSGCMGAIIIGGAAGALGGYAISKDTVQSETDTPYDALWNSAAEVARMRGTVEEENSAAGYLKFKAESSEVWVKLVRLTRATTRVKVSARRYHLPNLNLAEDIFVKIIGGAKPL